MMASVKWVTVIALVACVRVGTFAQATVNVGPGDDIDAAIEALQDSMQGI